MTPEEAVLTILDTVPNRRVRGKKRLQKLAYLWQASGVAIDAVFQIKHYGPFSSEIENSCALLTLFGDVQEREVKVGYADYLTTEYFLSNEQVITHPEITADQRSILADLDEFFTIDLEVASTVLFFRKSGLSFTESIRKTSLIKPTKVNSNTIDSSKRVMTRVGVKLDSNETTTHT